MPVQYRQSFTSSDPFPVNFYSEGDVARMKETAAKAFGLGQTLADAGSDLRDAVEMIHEINLQALELQKEKADAERERNEMETARDKAQEDVEAWKVAVETERRLKAGAFRERDSWRRKAESRLKLARRHRSERDCAESRARGHYAEIQRLKRGKG